MSMTEMESKVNELRELHRPSALAMWRSVFAVDLAPVTGVYDADHKLPVIHGVKDAVAADTQAQDTRITL